MKIETLAIIQARLGSKRLPKKMKMKILNLSLIDWVIKRVKKSKKITKIVLATTTLAEDNFFEKIAKKHKINIYRGSAKDVLSRFYKASLKYKPKKIVRVCGDNPFVDPDFLDDLITNFSSKKYDYGFNHQSKFKIKCVDGFGAEIFNFSTMEKLYFNIKNKLYREHVTLGLLKKKHKYKIQFIKPKKKFLISNIKYDINTIEDFTKIKSIVSEKKLKVFSSASEIISVN